MGQNCDSVWLPILLKELHSPHPELRFEAAKACAELEAEEAVPHLIELTRDSDVQIQISTIETLGQIGGSEAKEGLRQCLSSQKELIREAAKEALKEMRSREDPFSF